jgi:hypothetical protein
MDQDKWGEAFFYWFPYAQDKFAPDNYRIHSLEPIRANKVIVIVDGNNGIVEQSSASPTEAEETVYDDYAEIDFTGNEVDYKIGTAAHAADPTIPLFQATQLTLVATQDCWVRFNDAKRVRHPILVGETYVYQLKCSIIYVVRDVADGTLYLRATGVAL